MSNSNQKISIKDRLLDSIEFLGGVKMVGIIAGVVFAIYLFSSFIVLGSKPKKTNESPAPTLTSVEVVSEASAEEPA